ncbi:hypothetical protein CPELA_01315 [Corynebacterium pelargi]|uniref:Uncharacterized protein n=1 Tax=Corynebacterium pelargi TaxID=1471400 RepID=A0A410W6J1_9CORY|nr:hypothetical protein CPELA_01315 [Corynebacterium pelargi]
MDAPPSTATHLHKLEELTDLGLAAGAMRRQALEEGPFRSTTSKWRTELAEKTPTPIPLLPTAVPKLRQSSRKCDTPPC